MVISREVERRRHPWLSETFPVLVRGVEAHGEAFEIDTVLDNFSAGGLYVRLGQCVDPGTKLFAVVRLATALPSRIHAPCVAVRGGVWRGAARGAPA